MATDVRQTAAGERVAKAIARAGLASRREAEAWIAAGRVAVNGRVITSPALDVTRSDRVTVDGEMVVDGFIPLSEKPGIGVDINEEAMRQYAPQGVPFFA